MTDKINLSIEGIEPINLSEYANDAYLNYSMNVIRDRALPSVSDGLKPVQRRIVYAMSKLGISNSAKHVKSARTVGEVLGKYHPHGDVACYEAMVLMAQDFSYRYPLIDGQGNWGDVEDPKSFAAMRYTESRLTKYADVLLRDLDSGCVEFIANFDGTTVEPKALPARLPNILLNGTTGIAVGMATDIPPHNLNEVVNACIHLMDNENCTVEDLMQFIQGPDYPSGAEIINSKQDLLKIYETGRGSIRQRAVYSVQREGIVISALPYQVSCGDIEVQIADLMAKKKLPLVADLINSSDHENPCKLIIVPRSNRVDVDELMSHLFAVTDLESTYKVNLNILGLDGKPSVKSLKTILSEWITYRVNTVKARLTSQLKQAQRKLHLLEGLMIVFLNLDEVIRIIREEDKPKDVLIKSFNLSEEQVDYILETKLRQLARLEEIKLKAQRDDLLNEVEKLNALLSSDRKLKTFIKKEMQQDAKLFGDERICEVIERAEAKELNIEQLSPSVAMTVILSEKGWIRAANGADVDAETLTYRSGDCFQYKCTTRSNQSVVFLTNIGRSYCLDVKDLPSARGQGEPISSKLSFTTGEQAKYILCGSDSDYVLLTSSKANGFICPYKELVTRNKSGRTTINLDESELLEPCKFSAIEDHLIICASKQGKLIIYEASELPILSKGKGNRLMRIASSKLAIGIDGLAYSVVIKKGDSIIVHSGKRIYKLSDTDILSNISNRTSSGTSLPKGLQKVDYIEVVKSNEDDNFDSVEDNDFILE